jgi:AcrR family transcriptional regulator
MQILKDEIRILILKAGVDVFLEKGFHEASMKQISLKASVSTSNIYNYFNDKQHLFECIVQPVAKELPLIFNSLVDSEKRLDGNAPELLDLILEHIGARLERQHREMVLLFDGSRGSRYSNYKDEFVSLLQAHFLESRNESVRMEDMDLLFHIVANNLVEGILEIARHYRDNAQASTALKNLFIYHLHGMEPFL